MKTCSDTDEIRTVFFLQCHQQGACISLNKRFFSHVQVALSLTHLCR